MRRQGSGRGRHRNMYYLTGLPGFIRFGYSPGWAEENPSGLPPGAQYLTDTNQLDEFTSYITTKMQNRPLTPLLTGLNNEQKINVLKEQYQILKTRLEEIKKQIEVIEKK
jgi:hypothetical protein